MNRLVFPALLALALVARADQPELGQLDASPTLFTMMAALDAAGYGVDAASPHNLPIRAGVQAELAKRNIPSLGALKEFFAQHKRRTSLDDLNQYISFALTAGAPPDFAISQRQVDIPPDVTALSDLSPLLAAFYREGDIESLWQRSQPAIERYLERYHRPVSDAVLQVNSYLRQQTSGFKGRRFQVLVELLGPPNQVQSRSFGNEYTIVVTPSDELRTFDIRHAYLQYSLDPLATRYQEILDRKKGLLQYARKAPLLGGAFQDDILLLTTACLTRAVEARLDRNPALVHRDLLQGFILTPYFAEQLPLYEKQEQSMLAYYPTIVSGIDLYKEDRRLATVEFTPQPVAAIAAPATAAASAPLTGTAKMLDDAEQLYLARDKDPANLAQARKLYLEALQQNASPSVQASAYYGLARIATLEKDPETAQQLFQKALDLKPEPPVKAWVLVYLGRLSIASGDRKQAGQYFQDALQVNGATEGALKAAAQGVQLNSRP